MKEFIEELKHNKKLNDEKNLDNRININYVIERLESINNNAEVKELLQILTHKSVKTVFKAVVAFELGDLDYEYTEEEDKFLNKVFDEYMESKTITGLLNEELKELIEEIKELRD